MKVEATKIGTNVSETVTGTSVRDIEVREGFARTRETLALKLQLAGIFV